MLGARQTQPDYPLPLAHFAHKQAHHNHHRQESVQVPIPIPIPFPIPCLLSIGEFTFFSRV